MSLGAAGETVATACPHCGKKFRAPTAYVGKQGKCSACGQTFVIAPRPAAPQPAAAASAPAAPAGGACCGICHSPLAAGEAAADCPSCRARYHEECWQYNGGCGAYGCERAPATERLTSLEIPASHWGREEKPCPNCGEMIMAAAVRCRHCGATFASAAPEGAAAYRRQQDLRARLPGVRAGGIWLLVFSLIPCTAPFAAVIGLFWYLSQRKTIRGLPPLHAAICKIALGVAWLQSGLLIVCGFLASISRGAIL